MKNGYIVCMYHYATWHLERLILELENRSDRNLMRMEVHTDEQWTTTLI